MGLFRGGYIVAGPLALSKESAELFWNRGMGKVHSTRLGHASG